LVSRFRRSYPLLHARVQKVGTTGTSDSLILVRVWLDLYLLAGMSDPPTRCDRLARSRAGLRRRRPAPLAPPGAGDRCPLWPKH